MICNTLICLQGVPAAQDRNMYGRRGQYSKQLHIVGGS